MRYTEAEIRDHYRMLTELLIQRQLTITTMESATAGQIASLITDTEGSSVVLKGAFVTYSNEAKILQGVPREIIERYSVYSEETAAAMARACRKAYDADIGIGLTGTMGNVDPANPEASVPGQVYFSIALRSRTKASPGGSEALHQTEREAGPGGSEVSYRAESAAGTDSSAETYHIALAPQPTRLLYKLAVAEEICQVLMKKLTTGYGQEKD